MASILYHPLLIFALPMKDFSPMDKQSRYDALLPRIAALIDGEDDAMSAMANVSAALSAAFGWLWTGFYVVADDEWLHIGPFQGSVACRRIRHGRGVCGTAWATRQTQVVPDVSLFPGHIACSSLSRSEIVVPIADPSGRIRAVLDIDDSRPAAFDQTDRTALEQLCRLLARQLYSSPTT